MKAILYRGGQPNINGIVYPTEVLKGVVNSTPEMLVSIGTYPPEGYGRTPIDLEKVVGKATLAMEGDDVVAQFNVLELPMSGIVKDMIKVGDAMLMPTGEGSFAKDVTPPTLSDFKVTSLTLTSKAILPSGDNYKGMFEVK